MKTHIELLLGLACLASISAPTAEALTFVQPNVQPVYQFVIFPSSGFITEDENVTLDLDALGSVEISIDDADIAAFIANPTLPIPIDSAFGTFDGQLPAGTVLPVGTPFTLRAFELVSGQLENVTTDTAGAITGADATFTLLFDQILAPDTPMELRLFGAEMTFTGAIDSIPFSLGTSFESPEPVALFVDNGTPDGLQVGLVQNRFLNVVPEPSSLAVAALGIAAILRIRTRRG